jgi:hypothetical protein
VIGPSFFTLHWIDSGYQLRQQKAFAGSYCARLLKNKPKKGEKLPLPPDKAEPSEFAVESQPYGFSDMKIGACCSSR